MSYYEKYLKYKTKYLNLKAKHEMRGGNDKTLILFKADWCGHCNKFKPVWEKLQQTEKIKFVTYDADQHKNEVKSFQVQGFPTLLLKRGNEAIEYTGGRDLNSLKEFIRS